MLPDFASLNWHEPGSPELAELLLSRGLGVEVGIFHAEAAASWAESDIARHCMRVMIELGPDADTGTADDLLDRVRSANSPAPVLLHGLDESCWPLLEHAGRVGVQTRIGMEDTLRLPDGSTAAGNADLVAAAVRLLSVGDAVHGEVGEVEARHHHAADQARLIAARPGALPVPGWHHELCLLTGGDIAAEQMRCGSFAFGSHLQQQRAAAVVEPQLGTADRVPRRLLAGHQQEQDRGARVAGPRVVGRQRRLGDAQLAAPGLAKPATFRVRCQVELPGPVGELSHAFSVGRWR